MPATSSRQRRILVIDDNEDSARMLQILLKMKGHEVEIALDGSSGLVRAREFQPQIVVSDLRLPGQLNGFAVAKELRTDPSFRDICLIAVSGLERDAVQQKSSGAEFDYHLTKPVDLDLLEQLIDR